MSQPTLVCLYCGFVSYSGNDTEIHDERTDHGFTLDPDPCIHNRELRRQDCTTCTPPPEEEPQDPLDFEPRPWTRRSFRSS